MSKQTELITRMEENLDVGRAAADALEKALEEYNACIKGIRELEEYYFGGQWLRDFEAWENGKLPQDLKCGVLSEDAVYDLLTDECELITRMTDIASRYLKERRS